MQNETALAKRVLELFQYSETTGDFVFRQRRNRFKTGDRAGTISHGYVYISIDGKRYRAHRLAWLITHGHFPKNDIDHRNGERADNRLCNLREATMTQNMQNLRSPLITNKCGFLGVDFNKASGSWRAQIRVNGEKQYLGVYNTAEMAHAAYLIAKQRLHEFSLLAVPPSMTEPIRRVQLGVAGVKGVSRNGGRWIAYAPRRNGKQEILGRFVSKEDAIKRRYEFETSHS